MSNPAIQSPTFLFTDIEGSTRLWERYPGLMHRVLIRHDALAREMVTRHGGWIVKERGEGDSLFAVFESATDGVLAACALQSAFQSELWEGECAIRVRMALHRGSAEVRDQDYYGPTVNRCARLRAIGHGGQILMSQAIFDALEGALPADITLRDLGRHRLKDLQQPEQVYQVCPSGVSEDFPPLLSLNYLQHNLPIQTTSFVGRDREIAEIRSLLESHPELTLVGAGGSGKTRLALQAAADRIDQAVDGVWFVDLASVNDPGLVPQSVATVLCVREEPGKPLLQTLCAFLQSRSLLLVLDNCEHLITACAALVEAMVRICPRVKILATSREQLGIAGERVYPVPTLPLPPSRVDVTGSAPLAPSRMMQYASIRLFCERAALQQPDFVLSASNIDAVAQICRDLDGTPLAIELAAARVRSLSPSQILARLNDRFRLLRGSSRTVLPRQQTLEALIDWSYDLLLPPEKILLHNLTVFAGGWTLEAAERVASSPEDTLSADSPQPLEEWEVLDLLTSLIDKSLVVFSGESGKERYRLLETIRLYALMKREGEKGADTVVSRHTAYFMEFAREAESHLQGADQGQWLEKLEQEHDNLRAVLNTCLPEGANIDSVLARQGLELCGALWWFWHVRGYLKEGRIWLSRALAANPAPDEPRAGALTGLGMLALQSNDLTTAEAAHKEALEIRRANNNTRGVAVALANLGNVAFESKSLDQAHSFYQECIASWEQLGDNDALARTLNDLGMVAYAQGDLPNARDLCLQSLERFRAGRDVRSIAVTLYNLAELALHEQDYYVAESHLRECLSYLQQLDDRYVHAYAIHMLGIIAHYTEREEAAIRLLSAAQAAFEKIGACLKPADEQALERVRSQARERMGDARYADLWQAARTISLSEAAASLQYPVNSRTGS